VPFDVFPKLETTVLRPDGDDRLAPARGLVVGCVIGAGLWLGILWLIWRLL
jgi:hypothetical protein